MEGPIIVALTDDEVMRLVEASIDATLLQRFSKRRVLALFGLLKKWSFCLPGLPMLKREFEIRQSIDMLLESTKFTITLYGCGHDVQEAVLTFFDCCLAKV